jgi:hypothetical protein
MGRLSIRYHEEMHHACHSKNRVKEDAGNPRPDVRPHPTGYPQAPPSVCAISNALARLFHSPSSPKRTCRSCCHRTKAGEVRPRRVTAPGRESDLRSVRYSHNAVEITHSRYLKDWWDKKVEQVHYSLPEPFEFHVVSLSHYSVKEYIISQRL